MGRKVVGNDMAYIEGDLYYGADFQQQHPSVPLKEEVAPAKQTIGPSASRPMLPNLPPGTQVTRTQIPTVQPPIQPETQRMVFTPAPGAKVPPGLVSTQPTITPVAVRPSIPSVQPSRPPVTYEPGLKPPSVMYTLKVYTKKNGWLEQTTVDKDSALIQMKSARAVLQVNPDGDLVYMELRENGILIDSVGTMPGTVAPPVQPPVLPPTPPTQYTPPELPSTPDIQLPVAPGTPTDELVDELVYPDEYFHPTPTTTPTTTTPIIYTPPPKAPNMFDDFISWIENLLGIKKSISSGGFRTPRAPNAPRRQARPQPIVQPVQDYGLPPTEEYEYEDENFDEIWDQNELPIDDSMSDYQEAVNQETHYPDDQNIDYELYGIVSNEQRPEPRYERMRMIRRKGE